MTYEFTFLLNEEKELSVIKEIVIAHKGEVTSETTWGKKQLIYPIKKNYSATFYCWKIKMPKPNMSDFKKKLNYNEKIIRYLLLVS